MKHDNIRVKPLDFFLYNNNMKSKLTKSLISSSGLIVVATAPMVATSCSSKQETLSIKCENGTFVGHKNNGVWEWLGIPFAKPPVGEVRWKAPQKPDNSSDIKVCDKFSPAPVQIENYPYKSDKISEDCLYLNVWAADNDIKDRAVMVWIHGGSFTVGSISEDMYQGVNFVKAHPEIILVSIEYRLGMYGFIDLSSIVGGENFPTAPVNGLLDQALGINWVHDNITNFGGNKDNVTVFGQSSGGISAAIQAVMPEQYKAPIKKVIAESGNASLNIDKSYLKPNVDNLISVTHAKNMDDLMSISESDLIDIYINKGVGAHLWFPTFDNEVFSVGNAPNDRYLRGEASNIKFMAGATADESNIWMTETPFFNLEQLKEYATKSFAKSIATIPEDERPAIYDYLNTCRNHDDEALAKLELINDLSFKATSVKNVEVQSQYNDSYLYYWDYPSSVKDIGSPHSAELIFVFDQPTSQSNLINGTNADPKVYKIVQDLWSSFAITGIPKSGDFVWPKYTTSERNTLVIGGPEASGDRSTRVEKNWMLEQTLKAYPLFKYVIFFVNYYDLWE